MPEHADGEHSPDPREMALDRAKQDPALLARLRRSIEARQ
jgi:hypothetical protein